MQDSIQVSWPFWSWSCYKWAIDWQQLYEYFLQFYGGAIDENFMSHCQGNTELEYHGSFRVQLYLLTSIDTWNKQVVGWIVMSSLHSRLNSWSLASSICALTAIILHQVTMGLSKLYMVDWFIYITLKGNSGKKITWAQMKEGKNVINEPSLSPVCQMVLEIMYPISKSGICARWMSPICQISTSFSHKCVVKGIIC